MKRRSFGKLAGSTAVAMQAAGVARAQSARPDVSLLGTTLTPMGAEMAGNADGSIPAWTGGYNTMPAGYGPGQWVPDPYSSDQPLVTITASNMASHAALLTEGVQAMLTKYPEFKVIVYPTHRTACAPQWVYDNIKTNATSASFTPDDPVGGRFGFQGAFGGIPFPIPDVSNPTTAGAQIMWNNNVPWFGKAVTKLFSGWSVSNGQTSLAFSAQEKERYPYYIAQSLDELTGKYGNMLYQQLLPYNGPPNLVGQQVVAWGFIDPYKQPQSVWELLNGQGRVRRAPEIAFDTPSSQANGISGYDQYYGFNGSLERYDWKYLGKQEMYVPYNNNAIYASNQNDALLAHCIDPKLVRWEKHRVWVVEATLHPGERNVLARRRFYVDEDTWCVKIADGYDGNNALYKVDICYDRLEPQLPGVVYGNNTTNDLQADDWVAGQCVWNKDGVTYLDNWPSSTFDPANMAASAQY